jgi:serine/threonine protein phosphatase PrpC
MNMVQKKLETHPLLETDPAKALKDTFVEVDDMLRKDPAIDAELSGTTAVVTLCRYDPKVPTRARLWVANAGDSRCILAKKNSAGEIVAVDLSEDQKPDTPAEARRIKKAGGYVSEPEVEWGGPARVWLDATMTLPGLAMGRSIGDHLVSKVGVIAEPEVTTTDIKLGECENKGEDQFLVMASDGVWEFIESQAAAEIVNAFIQKSATEACTRLIETSAAKWRNEEGDYRDDITAVCVRLKDLFDAYHEQ